VSRSDAAPGLYQGEISGKAALLKPWGDRVLVRSWAGEQVRASGIILPTTARAKDDVQEGTVVRVGPDCKHLKGGERVLHVRVVGVAYSFEDDKDEHGRPVTYRMLHEHECLGVLEASDQIAESRDGRIWVNSDNPLPPWTPDAADIPDAVEFKDSLGRIVRYVREEAA
jgi:co-chaperonin GroES (HSP10)